MKYLALIVLVGFVAVGGFGFVGMSHDMSHGSGCIATVFNNNAICPEVGIASALYHIAAYQSFSLALVTSISLSLLALLLSLAGTSLWGKAFVPIPTRLSPHLPARTDESPHRKYIHWLSLFENSPTHS